MHRVAGLRRNRVIEVLRQVELADCSAKLVIENASSVSLSAGGAAPISPQLLLIDESGPPSRNEFCELSHLLTQNLDTFPIGCSPSQAGAVVARAR